MGGEPGSEWKRKRLPTDEKRELLAVGSGPEFGIQ